VEELFRAFEKAGPTARKTKQRLVNQMVEALSMHTSAEEELVYPVARAEASVATADVLDALEAHHILKWELLELTHTDVGDERFDAKVKLLIENVRRHVHEEERQLFPAMRRAMGRQRLVELGEAIDQAQQRLPTRPHPRLPEGSSGGVVTGTVTGVIDRVRDTVRRDV
jgi:iron-sulfur cluster repair protein YtfE (RIC family)